MTSIVSRRLPAAPLLALALAALVLLPACSTQPRPGTPVERHGDEIVAAGQYFRTGAPVVLWTDPGGYDAYRTEYRFEPFDDRRYNPDFRALYGPQRYNLREANLTDDEKELVRGGGWTLELLQREVDQFVIHYDVCGVSKRCFDVLHDHRGLSVHFLLDIDGTIYQTLDLKERAWHASHANTRSVGIEIAHMGAYKPGEPSPLDTWYASDEAGRTRLVVPETLEGGGVRTPGFVGRPAREGRITGQLHGSTYEQYDFTPEQYDSLIKLTAALCTIFPEMACDYPRNHDGELLTTVMSEEHYDRFGGLVGHFHLTTKKIDPGPAFDWDKVVTGARRLMR